MRYAQIRKMDISNGIGVGVSLFVQGCPFHCKDCFNPETWDFNGGKEWTDETLVAFLKYTNKPYVRRVSFLGGEPLANQNVGEVGNIIYAIKQTMPDKQIWLYSGFTIEHILYANATVEDGQRRNILANIDVLVDGQFDTNLKDARLSFRGSTNQRLIDVKNTLLFKKVVPYKLEN